MKDKRDIVNGKRCGRPGFWITTQGVNTRINKMNYFQLGATVKKIQRVTAESYVGIETKVPGVTTEEVTGLKLECNPKYMELKKAFDKQNYFNRRI
jgi:hypothetical protein